MGVLVKHVWIALVSLSAFGISGAYSLDDAKFSFVDGKCINAKGEEGLNPKTIGDCGDLRGMDFGKKDLRSKSLRGANFEGVNLAGAKLNGANFLKASLQKAKANDAVLDSADFTEAKLDQADFSRATGTSAVFTRASGNGLILKDVTLAKANFSGANLTAANLAGGTFSEASFGNALLRNAVLEKGKFPDATFASTDFSEATAISADFSRAKFPGTNFFSANLTQANLTESESDLADFSFAVLSMTKLSGVKFTSVNFFQTDVTKATGTKPSIQTSKAAESDFSGTKFENPNFMGFELIDSKLIGATWKNSNLTNTLLRGDNLDRANFEGSDLRAVRIENCLIGAAEFGSVDFRLARLQESGWEKAVLKGAKINSSTVHSFTDDQITRYGMIKIIRKKELGLFMDGDFVDTGESNSSEATNLKAIFDKDIVLTTKKFTADGLALDLDAIGTYMVPEMEVSQLPVEGSVLTSFQAFLADGGNLIVFYDADISMIRSITGAAVTTSNLETYPRVDSAMSDLGMKDLPASINQENATTGLDMASLPAGSKALYGNATSGGVVMIPYGRGKIWYLGWDFYGYTKTVADNVYWSDIVAAIVKKSGE